MNTIAGQRRIAFVTGGSGFVGTRLVKALIKKGWEVRSLARTPQARAVLEKLGATAVTGDLSDAKALESGFADVEVVFHVAALFKMWGDQREFDRVNVEGMRSVVATAVATPSVRKVVAVSAAAVVMGDPRPMLDIDESAPLQRHSFAPYSASKAQAEALLLAASQQRPGLETIALRPPMIWGAGMPMLDQLVQTVEAGHWQWIDDGAQKMSTCHVDNLVAALLLAADAGQTGHAYFIADNAQGTLKSVLSGLLATRHIQPGNKSVSFGMAWGLAGLMGWIWRLLRLKGEPPITRQMLRLIGKSFTVDCSNAARDLGYVPLTTWKTGIAEMNRSR